MPIESTTYDAMAARLLLAGAKPAALAKLADDAAIASGERCPECGCTHTEDNGAAEFRCTDCDHRWGFESGERYGF